MKEFTFVTIDGEERVIESKTIHLSDIRKCPGFIMLPSHYRNDGSCRHDEILCEAEGNSAFSQCDNLKHGEEIFCKLHLQSLYGLSEEDFDE